MNFIDRTKYAAKDVARSAGGIGPRYWKPLSPYEFQNSTSLNEIQNPTSGNGPSGNGSYIGGGPNPFNMPPSMQLYPMAVNDTAGYTDVGGNSPWNPSLPTPDFRRQLQILARSIIRNMPSPPYIASPQSGDVRTGQSNQLNNAALLRLSGVGGLFGSGGGSTFRPPLIERPEMTDTPYIRPVQRTRTNAIRAGALRNVQ